MIKFGDTFRYREKEYIFLAKTEEITYAAEILSREKSKLLENFYERQSANTARAQSIDNNLSYCFVTLSTVPFDGRAAYFVYTGKNEVASNDCAFTEPIKVLEDIDLKKILDEIKNGPLPKELKECVKDIDL